MAKIMMRGIDISNHQGKAKMDLDKVLTKHPEIKVVIIKSSEGTDFDDAYDEKYIDIALKHGCKVFAYHYARPSKSTWLTQAEFFLKLTKKYRGKIGYVLDWEVRADAYRSGWAKGWLDYVAKETGTTPIFYSYESMINDNNYAELTDYPLWVARYRDHVVDYNFDMSHAGTAPSVKWWSNYIAWQWTSAGRLDGYSGNLDCSVFYVDEDYLDGLMGKNADKKDDVIYTFPTTDPVRISNSGSDENGRYKNGKAGDQTGREWYIRDWYKYSSGWNCILRHPNANVRAMIAHLAVLSAENDKIGYDQNQRQTYWNELVKANYDPSKITTACESDCSAGVIAIVKATGHLLNIDALKDVGATYTGNMRSVFQKVGFDCLTASKYTTTDDYLVAGDVLLNDTHHTCIAVTNGIKSGAVKTPTATTTKEDYEMLPLLKKGAKGKAVKVLQLMLGNVTVDGDFGDKTLASVKAFQKAHGLEVDGEVGQNTWKALILAL